MKRFSVISAYMSIVCLLVTPPAWGSEPEKLSYPETLQRIINTYPSLTIAALQVQQARQNMAKVESTLGWNLFGEGGYNHDVSMFGVPSDVGDLSAGLNRKFESGQSIGLSGRYRYEDSELTFSPLFPNPAETTSLDLDYRVPFLRGKDNPDYKQGLVSAEAAVIFEKANQYSVRNQLADQARELFFGAATIQARYETARFGVERAKRLITYLKENFEMGLAEESDLLQAEAQLQLQISDMTTLQVLWEQQRTILNRLMGQPWEKEFIPELDERVMKKEYTKDELPDFIMQSEGNSPDMLRNNARLMESEAELIRRRDSRKDKLDLVLSVGTRTSSGNNATGFVDEKDVAGGLRLEYQNALDKRGFDADIYQAQLEKKIAEEDTRKVKDDLKYEVSGLVAEINSTRASVKSHRLRLKSEEAKFENALELYQSGRLSTDRLILFENDLQAARFSLDQQTINLEQRIRDLEITRGNIWEIVDYNPDKVARQ